MIGLPVAIGGIGGSGTRVVAEILLRQGLNLGSSLNQSNDNLIFTRNFKRPEWFKAYPDNDDLVAAWSSFRDEEKSNFAPATFDPAVDEAVNWGWKEPNTHIFLQFLSASVVGLKYVHVLRNGLDMAFSKNQQQATNWGNFILEDTYDGVVTPERSLDYWVAANQRVIEIGQSMGDRFLLIKYEQLCTNPVREIERLLTFVGRTGNPNGLKKLLKPTSIGRYRLEDLSRFSQKQLRSVEKLTDVDAV